MFAKTCVDRPEASLSPLPDARARGWRLAGFLMPVGSVELWWLCSWLQVIALLSHASHAIRFTTVR